MSRIEYIKRAQKVVVAECEAVSNVESLLTKDFAKAVSVIDNQKGSIIIIGMGKSGFISMKIAATLTSLGRPAFFLHPVDALHGDIGIINKKDVVLALSFSGRTHEVTRLCKYIKKTHGIPIIVLTGDIKSPLALMSDVHIILNVKKEGSPLELAPMASTTAMLVVGDALASALIEDKLFSRKHFAKLHPGGGLGMKLRTIREIIINKKDIPIVNEKSPILGVAQEITKKSMGIAVVLNSKGAISGIITDGDIRRAFLLKKDIGKIIAVDVMTPHPKTIGINTSLKTALLKMEKYKINTLFITNKENKLIGMANIHDVVADNVI